MGRKKKAQTTEAAYSEGATSPWPREQPTVFGFRRDRLRYMIELRADGVDLAFLRNRIVDVYVQFVGCDPSTMGCVGKASNFQLRDLPADLPATGAVATAPGLAGRAGRPARRRVVCDLHADAAAWERAWSLGEPASWVMRVREFEVTGVVG